MSNRLTWRTLWRSPGFELVLTRWARGEHPPGSDAVTETAVIEFMRRGSFEKRSSSGRVVGDANTVVLFNPREHFSVRHPAGTENSGVSLRVHDSALASLGLEMPGGSSTTEPRPFPLGSVMACGEVYLSLQRLVACILQGRGPDALRVEEAIVRLVRRVIESARRDASGPARARAFARRGTDRFHAAVEFLDQSVPRRVSLSEVAQAAGCSVWHLERVFREHAGIGVYRYATRLRLRHALSELVLGKRDLTRLALWAGFSSHSRFTASFRCEFGRVPSAVRDEICHASASPDRHLQPGIRHGAS